MSEGAAGNPATAEMGQRIGVRPFLEAGQQDFARLSGDRNPMHMDAVFARRTQAGASVVHGIHVVLWALDLLAAANAEIAELQSLGVSFQKFVRVGDEVELSYLSRRGAKLKVEAKVDGEVVAVLTLGFGPKAVGELGTFGKLVDLVVGDTPYVPDAAAMEARAGWLSPPAEAREFEALFPHACRVLGAERIRAFSLLSTLVGMVCPGLHSIFSGLTVRLVEGHGARPGVGVQTSSVDPRFRLATVAVAGSGIAGEVTAFERFAPVEQSLAGLRSEVSPGEFADRRALVIGGSRGLGATTAKLLAAGGARVVLTYRHGREEAEAIASELNREFGETACTAVPFEVGGDTRAQLGDLLQDFSHLYYFATPRIFRQSSKLYDASAFDEFFKIYALDFLDIVQAAAEIAPRRRFRAFYPSSVAVEQRPKQMTEYAMAKAAAEVLCQDLARGLPHVSVLVARLPRVLTDQTATVPPVEAAGSVETMLPLLRQESEQAS